MSVNDSDWLRELLVSVQLENFYLKFRDDHITLPSHFDHLPDDYLSRKGLSEPAKKRLLAAVKKAKKVEKKYVKKHGPILDKTANSTLNASAGHLIDESHIALGPELGDGSFGVVREGIWSNKGRQVKAGFGKNFHFQEVSFNFFPAKKTERTIFFLTTV